MIGVARPGSQSGFALIAVLGFVLVSTVVGISAYRTIHTDIDYTGRDLQRIRADFAAESAVQWALAEALRMDGDRQPLTRATHDSTGEHPLYTVPPAASDAPRPLLPAELASPQGIEVSRDQEGWIVAEIKGKEKTYSGGKSEILSFKLWYPNDSTVRITGRAQVDGVPSQINFLSKTRDVLTPI